MKKSELKNIIREEIQNVLKERIDYKEMKSAFKKFKNKLIYLS